MPLLGVTESHEESLTAVKERVPPPLFVTLTDEAAGFVPLPCVPPNDKVDEDRDKAGTGAGAATLKVTVIVAGEPCAPAAATVTCPV